MANVRKKSATKKPTQRKSASSKSAHKKPAIPKKHKLLTAEGWKRLMFGKSPKK
jgi:hypothetical protein